MKKFLDMIHNDHAQPFDNTFVTSDTHFGHKKIHNFEPIREQLRIEEGFEGTPDEYLIHKWNQQVGDNDLVIHLGDMHWNSFDHYADKLNGTILLVLGNHDKHPEYYDRFPNVYVVDGVWNLNGVPSEYYIPNNDDDMLSAIIISNYILSHYPIYNIEHEYNYQRTGSIINRMKILKEIADNCTDSEDELINVHGHLHSACPEGTENSINVCIDFNKYKMIRLEEIMSGN